jgi:Rrf2 family protein
MDRYSAPLANRPKTASDAGGLSLYGASVEYGIHCMIWLVQPRRRPVCSRDLAELQGISPALVARILPKLEKAGLVASTNGIHGGYRLARLPQDITMLDIVAAIDGGKRLFDFKDVRSRCLLFGGEPPLWSAHNGCGVHAVMLRAEQSMRHAMAGTSLLELANGFEIPEAFRKDVDRWLDGRGAGRESSRIAAVKTSVRRIATEKKS